MPLLPYSEGKEKFSFETQNLLAKLLRLQLDTEVAAESLRQRLAIKPDFNSHHVFLDLDLNEDGYITFNEFR